MAQPTSISQEAMFGWMEMIIMSWRCVKKEGLTKMTNKEETMMIMFMTMIMIVIMIFTMDIIISKVK